MNAKNGAELKKGRKTAKMFGMAIFYSSIQAAIGSVEMSSRFSVINFCKDQDTLQNAADALRGYIIIASIWSFGCGLVMFAQYSWYGLIVGIIANLVYIMWIYLSYQQAFKKAAIKYDLKMPKVF